MTNAERTYEELVNEVDRLQTRVVELEEAQQRLRESGQRFRTIFDQAAIGVALLDTKTGRFVQANKKYADLIGYSNEQMRQRTLREISCSQDLQEDLDNMQRLREGSIREFTMERRLVHSDGNAIWCKLTVSPTWKPGEEPDCHIAVVEDISRQKETELALRRSEARFRTLVENSYDVINLFSAEGELIYTSPSVKRVLGYDPEELIGTKGPILIHPDEIEDALQTFAEYADKPNATGHFVHRLRHKDGTYRTVEVTGTNLLYEPGVDAMVSIFHDVTDRICAEGDLKQSEQRYRTLIENAPDAIMVLDLEQERFVDVNVNATMLFGYSRDEFLALHPRRVSAQIQPDGRTFDEEFERLLPRLIAGEQVTFEWFHLRADGTEFPSEVRLIALPSTSDRHIRGSVVDITRRKQQDDRLREQEQALAHVSRLSTLGEMVAGIAHEINQPLSAISNFAAACNNVVNTTDGSATPMSEWTRHISDQAVRCGDIIRRLRDFVKKNDENRARINLNEVARESVALSNPDLRRCSVSVVCKLDESLPDVYVNRIQIEQVVVNLLRNACEAVSQQNSEDRTILLSSRASRKCVRLTVEDQGPGIPQQDMDRLFDTFFTTKSDGMGMGLAISRTIIEAHGGRLWVDKHRNDGATFLIELPLLQDVSESDVEQANSHC